MRRLLAVIAILIVGSIGLLLALLALGFLIDVLSALWTGVFERPDYRENTGDVRIVRATDPDWYWSNVQVYACLSFVLGSTAVPILWLLTLGIRECFRKSKRM
jgi:hypothetical protein